MGVSRQEDALLGQVVSRLSNRYRVEFDLQAKTGFTTADILRRLDDMPPRDYDVALTSLGVNDVLALTARATWLERQRQLRQLLRDKFAVRFTGVSVGQLPSRRADLFGMGRASRAQYPGARQLVSRPPLIME